MNQAVILLQIMAIYSKRVMVPVTCICYTTVMSKFYSQNYSVSMLVNPNYTDFCVNLNHRLFMTRLTSY